MKKFLIIIMVIALALVGAFALVGCNLGSGDKDSEGKCTIGVQGGTTGEFYLKGSEDWGFAGYSNIQRKSYNNGGLAVKDMINGNIDYVIIDNEPAKQLVEANKGKIKIIDVPLNEKEEYAFGVDKNQPELLANVNLILADMMANGDFKSIVDKYMGSGSSSIVGIESAEKNPNNPSGQLVVATNAAFRPFEYKLGNKFAGIDMEIAKYIADKLGLELVIEDMKFDSVVTSVGKNNVDIAMAGLTVNETRKQSVNFSNSYYTAYQSLIVPYDNTEFDGKTLAQIEEILKSK